MTETKDPVATAIASLDAAADAADDEAAGRDFIQKRLPPVLNELLLPWGLRAVIERIES